MTLETIVGDLRAFKQLELGTFQHVDELMNERRDNFELRNKGFYTADGEVYFLQDDVPMLAITRLDHNPVLNNIDDAFDQLVNTRNYRVSDEDAQGAISADDSVLVDLTKLRLFDHDSEYMYLGIGTRKKDYNKLNSEERKLAERVYGCGDDFVENMNMLNNGKGIAKTRIYVLNLEYVKEHADEGAVGRASWLYDFGSNSSFDSIVRYVYYDGSLRGVRVSVASQDKVPEGQDALKNQVVTPSFDDVIKYASPFVAETCRSDFDAGLRKLYKK